MMIIRVLPIHVPPCYEGGYLKPLHWNHNMTYDDHLVWPIHVPRRCEPLITPHLSLWGNARTRATFPTHKKSHNPHPQGGGGEGVKMGTLHWGGVGGGLAKPGSYIYVSNPGKSQLVALMETNDHGTWFPLSLCILNNFDISFLVSFSQDGGAKNLIFPGWPEISNWSSPILTSWH